MSCRIRLRDGGRPKAWLGAAISLVGGLMSSIRQADAQRAQARRERELEGFKNTSSLAANMTTQNSLTANANKAYQNMFRTQFRNGGRLRNVSGMVVQNGGVAQPIGNNTFLLRGMSHDDTDSKGRSGIYLKLNGREVEAEGGEVLHKDGNEFKIISNRIGSNGESFANQVIDGANPNEVYAEQEATKRRRLRLGGFSSPVREIAAYGWPTKVWNTFLTRGSRMLGFDRDNKEYQNALSRAKAVVANIPTEINGRRVSGVITNPEDLVEYNPITNTYSVRNPYISTGIAPSGAFRVNPAKIARGVQQTTRIATSVRNSMRGQIAANNARTAAKATEQANRAAAAIEAERRAQAALKSIGATADNAQTVYRNAYAGARTGSGSARDLIDLRRLYTGNPGLPPLGGVPEGSLNFRTGINLGTNARKVLPYVAGIGGAGTIIGGATYLARNNASNRTYPTTTPRINLGYTGVNPSVLDSTKVDSSLVVPTDSIVRDSTFIPVDSIKVNGQQVNTVLPNDTIVASLANPNSVTAVNTETDPLTLAEQQAGVVPPTSTGPARVTTSNTPTVTNSGTTTNKPAQSSNSMTAEERNRILRQGFGPYTTNYDNYGFLRTDADTSYPNGVRQDMQNRVAADMTDLEYNPNSGALEPSPTVSVDESLPTNRLGMRLSTGDWINAGVGVLGSILSNSILQRSLRNMGNYTPLRPIPYQAGKLVTNFSINPQLAEQERQRYEGFRDIDRTTASSVGNLARKNTINVSTTNAENQLFGQKQNIETELLNKDTLNQQHISNMNTREYNMWRDRVNEYNRGIGQARASSNVAMIQGIGDSISGLIESGMNNYNRDLDRRALAAASEPGTIERLINFGYPLDQQTYASIAINSKNKDSRELAFSKLTKRNQRRLRNGGLYVS